MRPRSPGRSVFRSPRRRAAAIRRAADGERVRYRRAPRWADAPQHDRARCGSLRAAPALRKARSEWRPAQPVASPAEWAASLAPGAAWAPPIVREAGPSARTARPPASRAPVRRELWHEDGSFLTLG